MGLTPDASHRGPPPKAVSPSRLARFYYHECERYLRFASVPRGARAAEGIPDPGDDERPVTRAILDSGYKWEQHVVEKSLSGRVHVAKANGRPLVDRIFDQNAARLAILSATPGTYVYQAELLPPDSFYQRYGIDRDAVVWPPCRPDLIECVEDDAGQILFRVIDVKASPGVKLSHRIQATLYSLVLEHLLAAWGVTDRSVSHEAGIWLAQQPSPDLFDVRAIRPPIEQFLEHELGRLLAAPADEAAWHVYFRCEWCPWFERCTTEMRRTDSVSRVPYLTPHGKAYLTSLDPPVRTTAELAALLDDPAGRTALSGSASLRGRAKRLRTQLAALSTGEVRVHAGSTLAMPKLENVRIVLTAQSEPVSGQVYAYGLYAQGIRDVLGDTRPRSIARVAVDGSQEAVVDLERGLVRDLWEVIAGVDAYNRGQAEWRDQKSMQTYVFDTYERDLVMEILMRRVFDDEVREYALRLLFHFQGEDLLTAREHPASEVFFPLVVLTSVLRDRVALPVEITYRFADAVRLLQPSSYGFEFTDNPYYAFRLSNQMRADAVHAVWYAAADQRIDGIEKEIRARLWGCNSLVSGLRERLDAAGALFAYPPKLALTGSFGYSSTTLSRLAFLAQYESALDYLETRARRTRDLDDRVAADDALVLRYLDDDRFAVRRCSDDAQLPTDGFPSHLLVEGSEAGRQAELAFDDHYNRDRLNVRRGMRLALAAPTSVDGTPPTELRLELTKGPDTPPLARGNEYVLSPRFTDFNTRRVIEELTTIDAEQESPFVTLIEDPHAFSEPVSLPATVLQDATEIGAHHGMTPSQRAALAGFLERRLHLVWGPPGTGKTHFLAVAVLAAAETHRRAGLPCRVMLTAFTHAAIENALRKVAQLQRDHCLVDADLPLAKLKHAQGDIGPTTTVIGDRQAEDWLQANPIAVLGGTVWGLRRISPGSADVVVIDEASQVRVPESAIAIRRLRPDGRLLVAGDDRQLPPIVKGSYPEPAPQEPLLHRSIFELLRRADPDEQYTTTLLENFRMNTTLCRYPAEQVYLDSYQPANATVARRALDLRGHPSTWADDVIGPTCPLVLCILEGVRATAENAVEADLVADAAAQLRTRLLAADGEAYPEGAEGDRAFWRDGLFIVSPHHAQIRAIGAALDRRRTWYADPFVDTVDKMQGQEADAVIVSYGVSDVEYALGEREFIYSLNRLNVAITRARAKTIVFLPRPLLDVPVAALDDDRNADGIAFMQGLWRWAEHHGTTTRRHLDSGGHLTTIRAASPPLSTSTI